MIYRFLNNKTEEFIVKNSHRYNNYFPLTNKSGTLLSSISPNLAGDIKKDNDHFLTPPASFIDTKYNPLCRREFFIKIGFNPESKKENKKREIIRISDPLSDRLEAGFFYHKLTKYTKSADIEILNFIPHNMDLELMQITVKNKSKKDLFVSGYSCIPLYGRSEATLRDHRHVSSLLNRIKLISRGILLRPELLFNEEGHRLNQTTYYCLGESPQAGILGQFPTFDDFCGQGGMAKPDAVYKNKRPAVKKLDKFDGKEVLAAIRFEDKLLKPGEKINYILALGISRGPEKKCRENIINAFSKVNTSEKVKKKLAATKKYWREKFSIIDFDFGNKNYNGWLRWIKAQPALRKLFGCSFLPHFDYGKGGRGWRDLWQDALVLMHYEPAPARKLIIDSFAGIRIDGSNATIIKKDNTFISDRNKISRVWSDHGIWPCFTLKFYSEFFQDRDILKEKVPYFKDHLLMRAKKTDFAFKQPDFKLRAEKNKIYYGSVLEHLLIQHLTAFFNVGKNNIIRLENGDWNDALDMAPKGGETVTFTFMYAHNLKSICGFLEKIKAKQKKIGILKEIMPLLDSFNEPVDYQNPDQKQKRLKQYLENTQKISGRKIKVSIDEIISDLNKKYKHMAGWLEKKEWLKQGFFNGYYDNKGKRVGGAHKGKVRMMLAPQVFAIMSGIATKKQIKTIWQAANKYLRGESGGFRLNTDFGSVYQDLGRAFGFEFGDKENGAFFSHMIIMFSYALYKRGFIKEAASAAGSIYKMAESKPAAAYPQLPEYFNSQGQALYLYLTGSASWYIHTLLTQVLGLKHFQKKSTAEPKLNHFWPAAESVKISWRKKGGNFSLKLKKT